jgi:hypothetical protein
MPIDLISKIKPKNSGQFPVYEDVDVEGGFQVRVDITDRDSIPTLNRKIGMLVFVQSDSTYYTLSGGITNLDWVAANIGSTVVAETLPVTVNGQILFTLSENPLAATTVNMFVNGLRQSYGTDFTISGTAVTFISPTLSLTTSDKVDFWYVSTNLSIGANLGIAVEQNSVSVDPSASKMNFTGSVTVTPVSSGYVSVNIDSPPGSKIRVFTAVNESGNAVDVAKTVVWDSTSSFLSVVNASITGGNTQLTTTQTGAFEVAGQLSIQPTADSVDGVVVNIKRNGITVHSVSDFGAIWNIGLTRSIGFNFPIELMAGDLIQVEWIHTGSVTSTTQLMGGDSLTWFSIDKLNSVTATAASAVDFSVTAVKTSTYTANTNELVQCNPTGGGFTVNLPTAGGRTGKHILVKNVSSSINTITIQPAGAETIDGSTPVLMNIGYQAIHVISNGTNWVII